MGLFGVVELGRVKPRLQADVGFVPLGLTTGKFILSGFAVGTATSTTLPCTIRIFTSGATAQAALVEISDANLTDAFTGLLLVSRGGNN